MAVLKLELNAFSYVKKCTNKHPVHTLITLKMQANVLL